MVTRQLWGKFSICCLMRATVRRRQGILNSHGVGKAKPRRGKVWGAALFKKFHPPLMESVPEVGNLHPTTPRSVIAANIGSGPQLPHTGVATHPEALPPYKRVMLDVT